MKPTRPPVAAPPRPSVRGQPAATTLTTDGDHWTGSFQAMASPCELLLDPVPLAEAQRVLHLVSREVWRIERKFSRYRLDSVLGRLHAAGGAPVSVDAETADLLDFAGECWTMSGGLFDITSGVLRRTWTFDGSDRIPAPAAVEALRPLVGWARISWQRPTITLPPGMELDFGGLGKEYAADRAAGLAREATRASFLVNLGGDLVTSGPRADGRSWVVGIEDPGAADTAVRRVELRAGAMATSGDSRRFLFRDGIRFSHILDPRTGWPVPGAPRSVTVAAPRCIEAGLLATLALLQGAQAEAFLEREGVQSWCLR